jgi:lipoate-protein ligase B
VGVVGATEGWHADWGLRPYREIHAVQERLVAARAEGRVPNLLLTGEHPPVITLGRKTPRDFAAGEGVPVVTIERGGEATYHGPGQLVAYPIVHLIEGRRDLHRFQRDLEEVGIRTCADLGVEAGRRDGLTGVWAGGKKVMSLGIAVRRWVTWHGVALNVWTNLEPFRRFNPCGLDGSVMTSLSVLLGRDVTVAEAREPLVRHACALLPGGPFRARPLPDVLAASGAVPAR